MMMKKEKRYYARMAMRSISELQAHRLVKLLLHPSPFVVSGGIRLAYPVGSQVKTWS
jgi:hypothetical protein